MKTTEPAPEELKAQCGRTGKKVQIVLWCNGALAEGAHGVCHGPSAPKQAILELNERLPGRNIGKEKSRNNSIHASGVEAEHIVP